MAKVSLGRKFEVDAFHLSRCAANISSFSILRCRCNLLVERWPYNREVGVLTFFHGNPEWGFRGKWSKCGLVESMIQGK